MTMFHMNITCGAVFQVHKTLNDIIKITLPCFHISCPFKVQTPLPTTLLTFPIPP